MKNDIAVNIVMPKELKEKAQMYANEMGISFNSLMRFSLIDYLKKNN